VHFTAKPIRSPDDLADEDPRLPALFHLDMLTRGQYLAPRGMLAVSLPMGGVGFLTAWWPHSEASSTTMGPYWNRKIELSLPETQSGH